MKFVGAQKESNCHIIFKCWQYFDQKERNNPEKQGFAFTSVNM